MLRDVASDQQTNSSMLSLTIDRDQAARFGIQPSLIDQTLDDAFGQRQVTQYFTQLNAYHVVLEITPRCKPIRRRCRRSMSSRRSPARWCRLSTFVKFDTQHVTFLSINHQGQFPAVTLSFNLAPGAALGDAVDAINRSRGVDPTAGVDQRQLPGIGAGVSELARRPSRT